MKKLLLIVLSLMLLTGCKSTEVRTVGMSALYAAVDDALSLEIPEASFNNAKKQYYTYYIPRGIGREERNATSNLFTIFGNNAILNLDVAAIVQAAHKNGESSREISSRLRRIGSFTYTTFRSEGTLTNSSGQEIQYRILVGEFAGNSSYIIIQTEHFNFSSVCPMLETDDMIYEMMKILRTCTVNTDLVTRDYSYVENKTEVFTPITLFKEMLPESGYVVDYIEDWKNDSSFTMIDYSRENEVPEDPGLPGDDVPDDLSTDDHVGEDTMNGDDQNTSAVDETQNTQQ